MLFQQRLFYLPYLLFIFPLCTSVCRLLDWSTRVHLFTLTAADYHVVLQPFTGAAYADGASMCQTFSINGPKVPQTWNRLNSETALIVRPQCSSDPPQNEKQNLFLSAAGWSWESRGETSVQGASVKSPSILWDTHVSACKAEIGLRGLKLISCSFRFDICVSYSPVRNRTKSFHKQHF